MTGRESIEARAARERRTDVAMARDALATYDAAPPAGKDHDVWRAEMVGALAAVDAVDGRR